MTVSKDLLPSAWLRIFALCMVGFPVFYLALTTLIFDLNSRGVLALALSPFFYVASAAWVMTGVWVLRLHRNAWYSLQIAQVLTLYLNALVLVQHSNSEMKLITFLLAVLFQALVYEAIRVEIRVPYVFPRIRWWESGIDVTRSIAAKVGGEISGQRFEKSVQILDISPMGCFLKTPETLPLDTPVWVALDHKNRSAQFHGRVVWLAKSSVTHPKGLGIQFVAMKWKSRRLAKFFSLWLRADAQRRDVKPPAP